MDRNNNAGMLIEEKDLKEDILVKSIDSLINDSDKLNTFKNNLNKLKVDGSATIIYNSIKKIVNR